MILFLYLLGPVVASLLIALVAAFIRRSPHVVLPKPVRQWTLIGMTVALGLMVAFTAWSALPWWLPPLEEGGFLLLQLARYITPLVLCVVALIFLIVPSPAPGPGGTAGLAPRTLMTFTSRAWLGTLACVVAAVFTTAILAGLASSPDGSGRYLMYEVKVSANTRASATIYGWWFSTPCLVLAAILVAMALIGLIVISRPPLARDAQGDTAARTARVRNILAVAAGGLLLHLSVVLQSLYATSSLRAGMTVGQAGWVELGPSFATIGPALQLAAVIAFILGMALWWSTLLSVLPARSPQANKSVLA